MASFATFPVRLPYALAALVGAALLVAWIALTGPSAGAQPAGSRCVSADASANPSQACIAIGKFSSPAGMTASFTSTIPGVAAFELVGTEAPGALITAPESLAKFTNVAPGTYTITETQGPGVVSRAIACDGSGAGSWTATFADNSITLIVQAGAFVTCDFATTTHSLSIAKVATPADGTNFAFSGGPGFTLDHADPDDNDGVASTTTIPVPWAGFGEQASITVTEALVPGWQLAAIDCVETPTTDPFDFDGTTVTTNPATRSVTATFEDLYARTVTCTFRNAQSAATCEGQAATIDMSTNGGLGGGTSGPDVIVGTSGVDVINGNGGDDLICALGGSDTINGGTGDDRILAGAGNDVIDGGDGRDAIYGDAGHDEIHGGLDIDKIWGGDGDDMIFGDGGSDRLRGGAGADTIEAGSGADRVWGGSGNDTIFGNGGQDDIWGEGGHDVVQANHQSDDVWGGPGNDTLSGAGGKDEIYGEGGNDVMNGGDNTDYLNGGGGTDIANGQKGKDNPLVHGVSGCVAETKTSC